VIVFDVGSVRFNYRAVGVALHGGKVLLHRAEKDPFWALPGGRVELLEAAGDTLRREMQEELGVPIVVAGTPERGVAESDFVVTTTPSREPYLEARWLHPGLHVTCMGSDMDDKQEMHPDCFARADLVACDRLEQCRVIGELHHALAAGVVAAQDVFELGALTGGCHPGRTDDRQITICDLTGVGVQDTAIARLAFARAIERGLGTAYDSI